MKRPPWRDNLLYMLSLAVLVEFVLIFLPSSSWLLLFTVHNPRAAIHMFFCLYRKEFLIHLLLISLATTGFMTASVRLRKYLGFTVSAFVLAFLFFSLKISPWKEECSFSYPEAIEFFLKDKERRILTFGGSSLLTDGKNILISDSREVRLERWYIKGFGIQLSSGRYLSAERFFGYILSRKTMNFVKRNMLSIFTIGVNPNSPEKFQSVFAQRVSLWAALTCTLLTGVAVSYLLSLQFSYHVCGTFSLILGMFNFPLISGVIFKWLWGFVRNGRLPSFLVPLIMVLTGVILLLLALSVYYSVMKLWREKEVL